jgi:predicted metalloprotease with PDZ domain
MATTLLLLAELHQHGVHLDSLLHRWWQDWQALPNQTLTPAKLLQDLQATCGHVHWSLWLAEIVEQPNEQLAEQLAVQLPQLGLVLTAKLQPSLGVKLGEEPGELIVKQLTSKSPAHLAGWQVGDELIALDNWRVRNATHVEQQLAIWQANPNTPPLMATLNRKGYLINTAIQPRLMATTYELAAINESSLTWLKP